MSSNHLDLEEAKRVLCLEASALTSLSTHLDHRFMKALDILENTKGRVIISGMGKSGHIGKKIAATFASTGTPALFIHPAEASHGDLGMLTKNDTLLAMSVSGETAELSDIILFASRHHIPLIAMTFNPHSSLAQTANICLSLPKEEEACPLGMAPTTSSTMMLALGDALAVCLLKRRGFSTEDFGSLHPGGKLGKKLLRVEQIMHQAKELPLLHDTVCMQEAVLEMTAKSLGCVGIVDTHGALVGVITDGDLRRHMSPELLHAQAREIMTPNPRTISGKMLVAEAVSFLSDNRITNVFVTEKKEGKEYPLGVLHIQTCLQAGFA